MTISKGSNLTVTSGVGPPSVASFSSSEAGIVFVGSTNSQARGYLLSISGTTVTKAGSETTLDTAIVGGFDRVQIHSVDANTLRMITVDNSIPSAVVHLVP